jgi:hypothetical protein
MKKKSEPEPIKNRAYFARLIRLRWNKARDSILEVGHLIIEARRTLPPDEYQKLRKVDLPFDYSTLQKLQRLAESERVNDPKNHDLLPHSWNTLYEIIHLSDEAFQAGIDRGIIHPEVTWKEIKKLRDEFDPELAMKRAKRAAAKSQDTSVIPLRKSRANHQTVRPAPATEVASAVGATLSVIGEETPDTEADEAVIVEGIGSAHATGPRAAAPSEALVSASVPVLNRIVAYVTDEIPQDQRDALLDDLRRLKSKHPFISTIQILVMERER